MIVNFAIPRGARQLSLATRIVSDAELEGWLNLQFTLGVSCFTDAVGALYNLPCKIATRKWYHTRIVIALGSMFTSPKRSVNPSIMFGVVTARTASSDGVI